MYPEQMNLYGDRGNLIALVMRARWRGIPVRYHSVGPGEGGDFSGYDICFMGGGQDHEQQLIGEDLVRRKGPDLKAAVEDGLVVFTVCGGYQLLGEYYTMGGGLKIPGLTLLDCRTDAGTRRMIGNLVVSSSFGGTVKTLVGFENHSGRTRLGGEVEPLGRVLKGFGNNGEDQTEGAVYKNCVGTYLHGSALPKNPWLTDVLLLRALERRYGRFDLEPLDDVVEQAAHRVAIRLAGA
ncbi:MAG: glutamine amidotransferase [Firmicutes bacterium]|nr:glutamine amidotransferase [Bacillota bacterium]